MNFLEGFNSNWTFQWTQKDFQTTFLLNYKQEYLNFLNQVKLWAAEKKKKTHKEKIFTNNSSYTDCVCSLFPALVSINCVTVKSTVPSTPRQFLFPALSSLVHSCQRSPISSFLPSETLCLFFCFSWKFWSHAFLRNLSCYQGSHSLCKLQSSHFCFKGTWCNIKTKEKPSKTCSAHKGIIRHGGLFWWKMHVFSCIMFSIY